MPIAAVLDELDAFAAQWDLALEEEGAYQCRRIRNRRPFRTPCSLWYLQRAGGSLQQQDAWARNLSERGIGLLTKFAIPIGSPVEIQITVPNRPPTHLAGVAAFCRGTAQGYHEVGVELKVRQDGPIFAHDPQSAVGVWPWLQEALADRPRRKGRHAERGSSTTDSDA